METQRPSQFSIGANNGGTPRRASTRTGNQSGKKLPDQTEGQGDSVAALKAKLGLHQFVGESAVLMAEIQKIPRYAATHATVLITGERGTGKGVAARAIHSLSP